MTKAPILQLLTALILLITGALLWMTGRDVDRELEAERALLTLQYGRALEDDATTAAARYWSGDYAAVDAEADPLLAANASYRAAVVTGGSAKEMITRLDDVVKRYAEVLRNDPDNEAAAFNYEYVVRYRSAIAARGVAVPPEEDEGLTPHGRAGAPPKGTSPQQFKVLVPMRPDERREAEEAGKSGRRTRKG
jgi:hypothetical protein